MDKGYNKTNPARLFMSNDRSVIEAVGQGGIYDDPLDLENSLKSFEYHLGDRQTQKLLVELINPGQQVENMLFASYAAANPRGSDPNGVYDGPDGTVRLKEDLERRVFYVKWGYPVIGSEEDGEPALSHTHKVELINMHYSFSDKKERVFKLEFVDAFTRAVLSDTFMNIPRTFTIPVNTMDKWRRPSVVLQELILNMFTNVEGYMGLSKASSTQNDIIDLEFQLLVAAACEQTPRLLASEIVAEAKLQGFQIPDVPIGASGGPYLADASDRFMLYSADYAPSLPGEYATQQQANDIKNKANEKILTGQGFRSVEGLRQFYGSLGLPLELPSGYDLSSIQVDRTGAAFIGEAGSPSIPTSFYSRSQAGIRTYGPQSTSSTAPGGDPYLKATTEASIINASELVGLFEIEPTSGLIDAMPRLVPVPGPPIPGGTFPTTMAVSSVAYWAAQYEAKVCLATKSPYGGLTTAVTKADLESMLVAGHMIVQYVPVTPPPPAFTAGNPGVPVEEQFKTAWFAFTAPNEISNSLEFPLTEANRDSIKYHIQILEARQNEFIQEREFDPGLDPSAATQVNHAALADYEGALAAVEPASGWDDLSSHSDPYWPFSPVTSANEARANPYLTPPEYRYNIKCNVETNELFKAVNKLLENLNKRFFKNADQFLQFVKIDIAGIPTDKRSAFELALGVNVSSEDWENNEGFVILSTVSFIRKLFETFSDGQIASFPSTDLTDEESAVSRTMSLAVGYESRSDNIVTDLQWTYPISHLLYGMRTQPVAISTVLNIAKRWPMMSASVVGPSSSPDDNNISQVIRIALQLNADANNAAKLGTFSPAASPSFPTLAADPTSPNANDIAGPNKEFFGIPFNADVRRGPEMTEHSLRAGDIVFTDAVLRAAQAQLLKMNRSDIATVNFLGSGGVALTAEQQSDLRTALLEDMKLIFQYDLVSTFFPALDVEDSTMVKNSLWVDGERMNTRVPTFRKINNTPLSTFVTGSSAGDVGAVSQELIAGKLEWLNTFSKTIVNAKASVLGIPEMDLIGDEIFNRNIFLEVNEPRNPGEQHWLTGIYNPKDIVHRMDSKGGYMMDMTLVRSSKDTREYTEKLRALRSSLGV